MSYASVESAIQTLLQAMSEFSNAEVTRGDYRQLDIAGADDVAVLTPGAFQQDGVGEAGARKSVRIWNVLIDQFRKYVDDGTTWTNFEATRDAIIVQLEKYPTLNGESGITLVAIDAGADPSLVYDREGNGPYFIVQEIRVAVTERVDLSGGEYT